VNIALIIELCSLYSCKSQGCGILHHNVDMIFIFFPTLLAVVCGLCHGLVDELPNRFVTLVNLMLNGVLPVSGVDW